MTAVNATVCSLMLLTMTCLCRLGLTVSVLNGTKHKMNCWLPELTRQPKCQLGDYVCVIIRPTRHFCLWIKEISRIITAITTTTGWSLSPPNQDHHRYHHHSLTILHSTGENIYSVENNLCSSGWHQAKNHWYDKQRAVHRDTRLSAKTLTGWVATSEFSLPGQYKNT